MKSETTVIASRSFESDSMWLNNEPVDISANKRLLTVIREFRASAQPFKSGDQVLIESNEWHECESSISETRICFLHMVTPRQVAHHLAQ